MTTRAPHEANPGGEAPDAAAAPAGAATVAAVRERYARIAQGEASGCCGAVTPIERRAAEEAAACSSGYAEGDLAAVPEGANLGLGCGAPVARLGLAPGETVLDLGSGPGLDALLAARAVGPRGRVIGVDMTPDMLARARAVAAEAGVTWIEFREGRLESLPVEDASVDAVTSNCVINLVPDKEAVFREVARVLRPGGRMVVSDIILDGDLPPVVARDLLAWAGCIAGAVPRQRYFAMIESAGLTRLRLLDDRDYLEHVQGALPDDLRDRMSAAGVPLDALRGIVRSVTYEARR